MAKGSSDASDTPKFRRTKQVTVPTLKLESEKPAFVRFETQMTTSNTSRVDREGKPEKPATVARVFNLDTEEYNQIVCPEVLKSNLNTHYPNESYVGKHFEIVMHAQAAGKRYRTVDIFEIEA